MKRKIILTIVGVLAICGIAYAATMSSVNAIVDSRSRTLIGINPATYTNDYVLSASTPVTVTIPTGANLALFSATGSFYVNWIGGTAAVPGANVTDGTGVELSPTNFRNVTGLSTISIISPSSIVVTIGFYTD
jgi:hypothetical protein